MMMTAAAISIGAYSDGSNAYALPWKLVARKRGLPFGMLDGSHRVADRHSGQQIERNGSRWELALVVDHNRRDFLGGPHQGVQGRLLPARRGNVDIV